MSWEDKRLSWNPEEYDNVTEISLPSNKLWVYMFNLNNFFLNNKKIIIIITL